MLQVRSYLTALGGVDVPAVLGSRATDMRGGLGGFQGRALQPGDRLGRVTQTDGSGKSSSQPTALVAVHDPLRNEANGTNKAGGKIWRLRVLPGPGDPSGGPEAGPAEKELQALAEAEFAVLPRSDRMAVCLALAADDADGADGAAAGVQKESHLIGGEQLSEACVSGTIQLPPDGNPLILLAEHQTTGGYKVPAVVIQADLWQVGQMRPGDSLRFDPTTPEIATAALRQLRAEATETKAQSVDTSGWDWVWDEESGDGDDDPNKVLSVLDPAPVSSAAKIRTTRYW